MKLDKLVEADDTTLILIIIIGVIVLAISILWKGHTFLRKIKELKKKENVEKTFIDEVSIIRQYVGWVKLTLGWGEQLNIQKDETVLPTLYAGAKLLKTIKVNTKILELFLVDTHDLNEKSINELSSFIAWTCKENGFELNIYLPKSTRSKEIYDSLNKALEEIKIQNISTNCVKINIK